MANIILQGKTVLVVSGNNSATSNIREKLGRYGLDFLVAPLGNRKNKEAFIASQTGIPLGISSWRANNKQILDRLSSKYKLLPEIFKLREDIAGYKLELSDIQMEKSHYQKEVMAKVSHVKIKGDISSRKLYEKVRILNRYAEVSSEEYLQGRWRLPSSVLRYILRLRCRYMLGQREPMTEDKLLKILSEYELLFYTMKEEELTGEIDSAERRLEEMKWDVVMDDISELSLMLFKSCLADLFSHDREIINDVRDIRRKGKDFLKDYPVVLSTTFSSRSCMGEYPLFDYVIMDEASQVSIETGVLALTCARNAVIVGDTLQLPNVVKDKDRERLRQIERRLNEIKNDFNVPDGYNCADNSFLSSVLAVIHSLPVTMLREHYRCHPDIINFCNQKFYNGELLIMTQKYGVHSPWCMITSSEGKHKIGKYNQREIDIIAREYLPGLGNHADIGIIAPYKEQVDHIKEQLDQKDVATVHKFQGREKDVIVFSVTDDEISEFADNANLLNVAVSRARKRFCLVVSGREQQRHGNIHDLMQYIRYCNGEVRKSRLNSIFDNLDRMKFTYADRNKKLSNKAEAVTYKLIKEIIPDYAETHSLDCVVHYKLSNLISDFSLLEEEERRYASHPGTHLDFIIYNKLTREALMAVETDGYTYHNKKTVQHRRDIMKDEILKKYGLALIRLKTNSCEERTLITKTLDTLLSVNEVSHTHGTYLHLIEEY